jgi:hypothetical protein
LLLDFEALPGSERYTSSETTQEIKDHVKGIQEQEAEEQKVVEESILERDKEDQAKIDEARRAVDKAA